MNEKNEPLLAENTAVQESTSKNSNKSATIWRKTATIGKKLGDSVQQHVNALSERAKAESYARRLKKYNPLFPDQYFSDTFALPNMIVIVDDAVRRDIDVCEGAIGWLSKEADTEILYLYDEFVPNCGLRFVPAATCDAVFYVDKFERQKFIQIDCFFEKAHEEKLAELEHIAYSLGAKLCSVEIVEAEAAAEHHRKKSDGKTAFSTIGGTKVGKDQTDDQKTTSRRSGKAVSHFAGSDTPIRPTLKWFAHDDSIKHLIEMRCSNANAIQERTLELSGSASATLSQKAASSIDSTLKKIGNKTVSLLEARAVKEQQHTLIFEIVF